METLGYNTRIIGKLNGKIYDVCEICRYSPGGYMQMRYFVAQMLRQGQIVEVKYF